MEELIAHQRFTLDDTSPDTVPPSTLRLNSLPTASTADRWVNGFWFVSLAISLFTALLSTLVKMWIQAYVSPTFGSPHTQSKVRHFRYMGMQEWNVPLIVGLLPILLHLSLSLFFAGLVIFLFILDPIIARFVWFVGLLAFTAYIVSDLLPVWYPHCPYKTPY